MSESALKTSTNADASGLVAKVDELRLQDIPVTKACQRVGLDRNAYYNFKRNGKRSQKENGGTATTVTAGIDNPTETQGVKPNDTKVSPNAGGIS